VKYPTSNASSSLDINRSSYNISRESFAANVLASNSHLFQSQSILMERISRTTFAANVLASNIHLFQTESLLIGRMSSETFAANVLASKVKNLQQMS
jgi:hypothetical protein